MMGTIALSLVGLWLFGVMYTAFIALVTANAANNMYARFESQYDPTQFHTTTSS